MDTFRVRASAHVFSDIQSAIQSRWPSETLLEPLSPERMLECS
jgi:hypothetical protein